jgi:NADH dehydrogenase
MLLIIGGTGFVGGYILEALDGQIPSDQIRVISRDQASLEKLKAQGYDTVAGNVANQDDLRRATQGVDNVIFLTAIIREVRGKGQTFDAVIGQGAENMVQAAKEAGVTRILFMSALGADDIDTGYFKNKLRGERAVKESGIPYVIFRPSFLIGPGGEFPGLLKQLTNFPIVPVLGSGKYPVQPMYVRDMARYFASALTDDRYTNQTFDVGGPETFEFNEMLRQTLTARHKKGWLFHAPLFLVRPMIPIIEAVMPKLITRDQFKMLIGGSSTQDNRIAQLGGFDLTPFRKAIAIALHGTPPPTYAKGKPKPRHAT